MSVSELKTQIRIQKLKLNRKDAEISRLQAALSLFLKKNESQESVVEQEQDLSTHGSDEEMDVGTDAEKGDQEEEEMEEDEDDEPSKPVFDDLTGLYFCPECMAEIDEGFCSACGHEYEWRENDPSRNTRSTENQAIHHDRCLVPRGNTPLLPDDGILDRYPPPTEYREEHREDEYKELLRRGATRLMCETFHLDFSKRGGIYAWADPQLFEEFSGPAMRKGDFWKIHLGRRISLEEDDEDGAAFIEGLLEDALLFPYRGPISERTYEKWETVEDRPGIWVTRLKAHRHHTEESAGANEFDSDDEDRDRDMEHANLSEDLALEKPPKKDRGPIRTDRYTYTDDEVEESEDSEEGTYDEDGDEDENNEDGNEDENDEDEDEDENNDMDMGASIAAQAPDAVWEPSSDEDSDDSENISDDSEVEWFDHAIDGLEPTKSSASG